MRVASRSSRLIRVKPANKRNLASHVSCSVRLVGVDGNKMVINESLQRDFYFLIQLSSEKIGTH